MIESLITAYDFRIDTQNPIYIFQQAFYEEVQDNERMINLTDFYQKEAFKTSLNDNYLELIRDIESFSKLKPDWMGKGSIPITKDVTKNAKVFLDNLDYNVLNSENLEIHPSPHGTVIFDIDKEQKEFSVEIGASLISYYIDSNGSFFEEDNIPTSDIGMIMEKISSFLD